jgi:TorA maturation chaperone TorD
VIASVRSFGALSRALAPPRGDAAAFPALGLPAPQPNGLEFEHAALFGRAGRAIVSPYEGVHRGTSMHRVLAAYAAGGFAPDPAFPDRPDHVCMELAFLEGLGRRRLRALERRNRTAADALAARAREFFADHVWAWVPALFDAMARAEGFPLHGALAERAGAFLDRHAERAGLSREQAPEPPPPPAQPQCKTCGAPLGVSLPEHYGPRPPWGSVCLRCRLRADLRRSQS